MRPRRRRRRARENKTKIDGPLGRQHGMVWAEILLSAWRVPTAANHENGGTGRGETRAWMQ